MYYTFEETGGFVCEMTIPNRINDRTMYSTPCVNKTNHKQFTVKSTIKILKESIQYEYDNS